MDLYQSGSPPEGPDRPLPGIIGCPGIPVSAGIQNGIRISWRKGTPAGSRVAPGLVTAPRRDTARGVAVNCMPAARVNGSAAFAVMTSTPGKPGRAERWLGDARRGGLRAGGRL